LVSISRANVKRVKDKGINVIIQKSMAGVQILLNAQYVEGIPAHNEKVREALNLAIDRKAIVDTIFQGMGQPLGTFFTTSVALESMGYNWREDLYPYDPQRARKLLAEAGYPNGFEMEVYVYPYFDITEGPDVMQAVAAMWNAIGVRTRLIQTEYGVVRAKLLKKDFPGAATYNPPRPRAWQGLLGYYQAHLHSSGAMAFIKDSEMDKKLDEASQTLESKIAKDNIMWAAKYVRKHHHLVPVLEYDVVYGVSKKAAHWKPGPLPGYYYLDSLCGSQ